MTTLNHFATTKIHLIIIQKLSACNTHQYLVEIFSQLNTVIIIRY